MKNVKKSQKKTCIFLNTDEFDNILHSLYGDELVIKYLLDGLDIYYENEYFDFSKLKKDLASYFDVSSVTSIHIDDCYEVGVWVVYKE